MSTSTNTSQAVQALLDNGWTFDSAEAHVSGNCDRLLCTGKHGPTWDELGTLIREALVASTQAAYTRGRFSADGLGVTLEDYTSSTDAEQAAVATMWRAFYDLASNDGQEA